MTTMHLPSRLLLPLAAALLAGCAATPLQPTITGYSCCNLGVEYGWIARSNVQGQRTIPAGEPMTVESIKKTHYLYGSLGDLQVGWYDDIGKTREDALRWVNQLVVKEDPRVQMAGWSAESRAAVQAGRVRLGMTKAQVLMALGPPPPGETADTAAAVWTYWTSSDKTVDLRFAADGTLAALEGEPSVARALNFDR